MTPTPIGKGTKLVAGGDISPAGGFCVEKGSKPQVGTPTPAWHRPHESWCIAFYHLPAPLKTLSLPPWEPWPLLQGCTRLVVQPLPLAWGGSRDCWLLARLSRLHAPREWASHPPGLPLGSFPFPMVPETVFKSVILRVLEQIALPLQGHFVSLVKPVA